MAHKALTSLLGIFALTVLTLSLASAVSLDPIANSNIPSSVAEDAGSFDITFDLEENSLGKSDKLVMWITLQNFGKRYVPARLIYSVTDEVGVEVYREFEEVRVYTDQSIIKRFDNLVLEEGT